EKQYEDLKVQTFQLNKLDAKKAVNLIRTMLPAKKIYVNEDINALVMRDTPESLEVARKILEANDIQDAEVVLEVEIMEISKDKEENFGLALSKYAVSAQLYKNGQPISDTLTTTTTTTTGTTTTTTNPNLAQIFSWGQYSGFMTVPSATFNFAKTLADGQTLSNPKIRVKNREKAKFTVGQRIPITTTSSTTVGGTNVNVQYVDVGVKMNAEPVIQLDNEISIKVSLEVSSAGAPRDVGSGNQVVDINNRNLDTVLSLKDGETSIIGGLIELIDSNSRSKIAILGDIPIIGSLLTNKIISNKKGELILAITPHIVRGITVPDADVSSFWSGKEDNPSVTNPYGSFVQEPDIPAPPPSQKAAPPGQATQPGAPATAIPGTNAPQRQSAVTPPQASATPSPAPGAAPVSIASPPSAVQSAQPVAAQAPPQGGAVLPQNTIAGGTPPASGVHPPIPLNLSVPSSVGVDERFIVTITAANATDLYNAPFVLSYDPLLLDYEGASEGSLLNSDGKQTTFQASGVKSSGQVSVGLARSGNVGGVNGSGNLAILTFRAKAPGKAGIGFLSSAFTDDGGRPLEVTTSKAVVEVKQPGGAPAGK
ncbi:MAG TPA: cohesin domain-containing protein, partial [Geobacteraceae bacterium]|nr:cohesin domain-containing protein [Geobacteraceae bacterium]